MFQCPKCQGSDALKITVQMTTTAYVDTHGNVCDSEQMGGLEWDNSNRAACGDCNWTGTVHHMTITEERETNP